MQRRGQIRDICRGRTRYEIVIKNWRDIRVKMMSRF